MLVVTLLCISFLPWLIITAPTVNDEIDTISQRILELTIWPKPENVSDLVQRVLNYSQTLNSSCYWPDINYEDQSIVVWDTERHMFKISNMLRALTVNGSSLKNDPKLMSQVHCALNVWFTNDWKNPNWWFNQIGVPLEAGMQLLMLGANATSAEIDGLKKITFRSCWWLPSPFYVGANLIWMLQIQLYRSLATRNTTGIEQGFSRMWQDVVVSNTSNQGVQPDWSYHFHTRQILPGSYGLVWANDILLFIQCSSSTPYQPDDQTLLLLANFLTKGDAWVIMTDEWDWSTVGRSISVPGNGFAHGFITDWIRTIAQLVKSTELKANLNNLADRLDNKNNIPLIGNRHYFTSDYQVHRRKNWVATVKMLSSRTIPTECLLNQNTKDEHSSQGLLNLYRTGFNDYSDIFPIIDWQAMNGITVIHDIPLANCSFPRQYRRFVGGASDDQYGVAMMDGVSHNMSSQRSWHFYDDAIIALATNITLNTSTTAWTALASRLLSSGQITVGFFNSTIVTLNDGNYSFPHVQGQTSNVQWLHIGESNIGYVLPLEQEYKSVGVEVGVKTGNYLEIGPFNQSVTARMVTLYLNHGLGPYAVNYNYVILPNVTLESMPTLIKRYEEEQVFACISSTGVFHGTMWPTLKRAAFVLWVNESTTFSCKSPTFNLNITLFNTATFLYSETDTDFTLTASNPIRTNGVLTVAVDRMGVGEGCASSLDMNEPRTNVTLVIPTELQLLGSSVNVTCKKQTIIA